METVRCSNISFVTNLDGLLLHLDCELLIARTTYWRQLLRLIATEVCIVAQIFLELDTQCLQLKLLFVSQIFLALDIDVVGILRIWKMLTQGLAWCETNQHAS